MLHIIVFIGILLIGLERIIPDQALPKVRHWWVRVVVLNCFQLGILLLGSVTWEKWFYRWTLFPMRDRVSPILGAVIVYLVLTFIYYWWHRARHDINFLWLTLHQLHHSPQRIETITSFYKHPVEILANALLISGVSNVVFGLDATGVAWVNLFTALAEYFYHMNIRTPQWVGYIIQRPESHRIHHQLGRHYDNFADLPLWDMLFGTFNNPKTFSGPCGYKPEREAKFLEMLAFRNVNNSLSAHPKKERQSS